MDGRVLVLVESERPASRLLFVFVILPGAIFQMGLYVCFFHCYQCAPRNFSLSSPASAALRLHPASANITVCLRLRVIWSFSNVELHRGH